MSSNANGDTNPPDSSGATGSGEPSGASASSGPSQATNLLYQGAGLLKQGATVALSTAQDSHQQVSAGYRQGGALGAVATTVGLGAKAAVTGFAVAEGVKGAVTDKALEAGAIATQAAVEAVPPDTQQRILRHAETAKSYAVPVASQAASAGLNLANHGYSTYTAANAVVAKQLDNAYQALPDDQKQAIEARRQKVAANLERAKGCLLDVSSPVRQSLYTVIRDTLLKNAVDDPDMWGWVKRLITVLMNDFWADVEVEVERGIEASVFKQPEMPEEKIQSPKTCLQRLCCCCVCFQNFILYHYLPCDKSIFGSFKNPVYLLIVGITCIPFFSIRVIFFLFLLMLLGLASDGLDEYQLISFVLSAKGMQFFTGGILANAYGASQYYYALQFCELSQDCIDRHSPGGSEPMWIVPVFDFFGSVIVVWIAFGLLSCSSKHGLQTQRQMLRQTMRGEQGADQAAPESKGGRLLRLLWWDLGCFSFCCCGLAALQYVTKAELDSKTFRANIFWCRVMYSLTAFPFFFFAIPGLRQVLTHAEPTGFSRNGRCVPLIIGSPPRQPPQEAAYHTIEAAPQATP